VLTHEFFPYRGGIAVYVEETARAAAATGQKVTVWAPDSWALRSQSWPFEVRTVEMRGTLNWNCRLAMMKAIREAKKQLAQSIVWLPEPGALLTGMYLNMLGRLPAKKLVLTLHGSEILRFGYRPHRRILFQKLLDRADRVGVVSDFTHGLLQKYFQVAPEKIVKVSGALRSDFVEKIPPRLEKKPGEPLTLLTVGRVHPRKGQNAVLEALAQMNPRPQIPLTYHIAGQVVYRDYYNKLEALAKNCGVDVQFLGAVPDADLPALYAQADIFLLTPEPHGPSVEGFGLVYLEAAAAGLPVIAHRTGGVAEAVRDGVTGILVEPTDRAALANAIVSLINDASKRAWFMEAGKIRAKELSWLKNVKALFTDLA
jgi:glycosyltransferase involved in cell wall biosynthesis